MDKKDKADQKDQKEKEIASAKSTIEGKNTPVVEDKPEDKTIKRSFYWTYS